MHFTVLAAVASAALVAATPIRRDPVTIPDLPDCPPAIIALLPNCVANPSDTCFNNAPAFPAKCLDEIKKAFPSLPGLPATGVAVAADAAPATGPATNPIRRGSVTIPPLPDCPPAIIALLPNCVANPSDTCFNGAPAFPAKCLEEIKKAFPSLQGLPAAGVSTNPIRRGSVTIPPLPDCPPAIIALLPNCVANPSDTCFDNAPAFPAKCLDEIKNAFPALSGLPATGAAVAAPATGPAANPIRRDSVTIPPLPDCPPAIIALLPNCVANPSDTCFNGAPAFPAKCLEEIKKAFPSLQGLPATGV